MMFFGGKGKTVILVEKAKRLAERGEHVTFIVVHDQKPRNQKSLASDNFLLRSLEAQFAGMRTVYLEFANIWKVLKIVHQLMKANVHIFLDEFSFQEVEDDPGAATKMLQYVASFQLPQVLNCKIRAHEAIFKMFVVPGV